MNDTTLRSPVAHAGARWLQFRRLTLTPVGRPAKPVQPQNQGIQMAAEANERDQRSVPGTVTVNLATPGYAVVALRGEHDLSTQPQVRDAFERVGGRTNVVVDLSECEFLDSRTVGMLVATDHGLRERGGRLEIALPPPPSVVHRIFEILGIGAVLSLHDTPEQAQRNVCEEDESTARRWLAPSPPLAFD
jgi:anti-anti-sigma factor